MSEVREIRKEDVRKGDRIRVTFEEVRSNGAPDEIKVTRRITKEGVTHTQDPDGDWQTNGGLYLTYAPGEPIVSIELLDRPRPALPTELGAVIANVKDEHGVTWPIAVLADTDDLPWRVQGFYGNDSWRRPDSIEDFTVIEGLNLKTLADEVAA